MLSTSLNEENKTSGKNFYKNLGLTIGAIAAASFVPSFGVIGAVATLGLAPVILTGAQIGLGLTGGFFGIQAYHNAKIIGASKSFKSFIKGKEQKWKEIKSGPNLKKRLAAGFAKVAAFGAYTVSAAAAGLATASALVTNGIVTAPAVTTALSQVAALPVTLGATAAALTLPAMLTVGASAAAATLVVGLGLSFTAKKLLKKPGEEKTAKKGFFSGLSLTGGSSKKAGNDNSPKNSFDTVAPKKAVSAALSEEALARKARRKAAKKSNTPS